MTPKQLDQLLTKNGLSQSDAARELGLDPRSMRRYLAGDIEIPRVVEIAIGTVTETWNSSLQLRTVNARYRSIVDVVEKELRRIVTADSSDRQRIALSALKKIVDMKARPF